MVCILHVLNKQLNVWIVCLSQVGINSRPEDQGSRTWELRTKDWGIHHGLESRIPYWDSRIWNLASTRKLYNFRYFRILYLNKFQLPWNLTRNPNKHSEFHMLLYFVIDPSPGTRGPEGNTKTWITDSLITTLHYRRLYCIVLQVVNIIFLS